MAPKRRTTDDDEGSSSEDGGGSGSGSPSPQPAKRARRETNDDDERIRTEREEAEFEEQHIEAMRAAIQNKIKVKGGIAQTGIINKIEVHNFLCHEHLEVEFGPQINFIIGVCFRFLCVRLVRGLMSEQRGLFRAQWEYVLRIFVSALGTYADGFHRWEKRDHVRHSRCSRW